MLTKQCSQPIKYRVRQQQPITERLQSISLKFRFSELSDFKMKNKIIIKIYVKKCNKSEGLDLKVM